MNIQNNQINNELNAFPFEFKFREKNATQRKNLAEMTLLENGMILGCNTAGAELLGATPGKLVWRHIARLLPQLADISLILDKKINPYLNFLSLSGHRFEVIGVNGVSITCELIFKVLEEFDRHCLRITLYPINEQ